MPLSEAAAALGARMVGGDVVFESVSIDSRTVQPGDIFVAIRGERFDGHRFLANAARSGAVAAIVEEKAIGEQDAAGVLPLILVPDTRLALGQLSAHWRSRFAIPVAALTGSSGKTTVKEMLALILGEAVDGEAQSGYGGSRVLATRGNLNNDIGVPLTLLELESRHLYAVIEMGMNHAGEIRYLTQLARPDVALVTNAGQAHLEFLGSREAIARAKGEIFEGLGTGGAAVINADDPFAAMWREIASGARIVDFGLKPDAAVSATYTLHQLESEILVTTPRGEASVLLKAPGLHNVRNALAAAAAATAVDVAPPIIAAGLSRFSGIKGRLQQRAAIRGALLIDDTYNANPESVRAAIAVIARASGRRVVVLGDMGELGADGERLHAEIGEAARVAGVERLLTFGELSAHAAEAFGEGARHFTRLEDLLAELENALAPQVTVLVKGSRFMRMERVVKAFALDGEEHGASSLKEHA